MEPYQSAEDQLQSAYHDETRHQPQKQQLYLNRSTRKSGQQPITIVVYILRADKRASSRAEMPFPWYQPAHTFVDVAKKKMEERQTFRLPSIPRETKLSCFCWAKSWQQILKRFYTGSMSKGGPGSQRRSLPFCRNPFKKKKKAWLSFASIFGSIQYLRLFWSDCSHWKGYLLTISSLIETKKNYFISFWSANTVLLEVQGSLAIAIRIQKPAQKTIWHKSNYKKNIRCSCKTIILKIKPLFHAERSFRLGAILFAQFWATLLAARVKS